MRPRQHFGRRKPWGMGWPCRLWRLRTLRRRLCGLSATPGRTSKPVVEQPVIHLHLPWNSGAGEHTVLHSIAPLSYCTSAISVSGSSESLTGVPPAPSLPSYSVRGSKQMSKWGTLPSRQRPSLGCRGDEANCCTTSWAPGGCATLPLGDCAVDARRRGAPGANGGNGGRRSGRPAGARQRSIQAGRVSRRAAQGRVYCYFME
jgi:hypothetical protein